MLILGGSVYIVGKENINLKDVYMNNMRKRYLATHGQNSKKIKLFGENGADIRIQVPCGVTAIREDTGENLGEVNTDEEQVLLIKGGKGASEANRYTEELGQHFMVNLDLKLIADVGLIGFPNAGKSTLLSLVSRARPKIANYPFTTLNPQIGAIEFDDGRMITIADLPGIIEGAHFNRGKGHKFLKHISRTRLNLFIVDINGFTLNERYEAHTPFETLVFLNKELEMFDDSLIDKPSILLLNKTDSEDSQEKCRQFFEDYNNYEKALDRFEEYWKPNKRVKFDTIIESSVKNNVNIDKLCVKLRELIDDSEIKKSITRKETLQEDDEKDKNSNNQRDQKSNKLF